MAETPRRLRVALVAEQDSCRQRLTKALEGNGLRVVLTRGLKSLDPLQLTHRVADVLLVNLEDSMEAELERLEALIEHSSLPILFNEGGTPGNGDWAKSLARKLAALAATAPSSPQTDAPIPDGPVENGASLRIIEGGMAGDVPARHVWVLGASLGGPQALKAFLSQLTENLPIALVVAQHIGTGFVDLLAEQLNRVTHFEVSTARSGTTLRHGQVLVVPVDGRFTVDPAGSVAILPEKRRTNYSPSVDAVMTEMAARYGSHCGAIIFSGMGDDGARGCLDVAQGGGEVWAQTADTCVISSMPDSARRTGVVAWSGSPEELAGRLADHVMQRQMIAG